MEYPLSQQGFDLKVSIEEKLPSVSADADALEQAILNLLSNAMKYSRSSRQIDLCCGSNNGDAVIAVTDHGIGIAADDQPPHFRKILSCPIGRHRPDCGDRARANSGETHRASAWRLRASSKRAGQRQHILDSNSRFSGGIVMIKVLVVEDDAAILRGLADNLKFKDTKFSPLPMVRSAPGCSAPINRI